MWHMPMPVKQNYTLFHCKVPLCICDNNTGWVIGLYAAWLHCCTAAFISYGEQRVFVFAV